ncbi:hypothetical protein CSUI_008468 [Cystoisospora suis]|uniref:Uncharacterized protein n=1 Tax=Cystoisospora suis TaxID=483139 RepID=A0A2C6KMU5_9APIC|nr:hypothetical protein CSUI_008468 [Cystoisospora suis]
MLQPVPTVRREEAERPEETPAQREIQRQMENLLPEVQELRMRLEQEAQQTRSQQSEESEAAPRARKTKED